MKQREIALERQKQSAQETEQPLMISGLRCCIDCFSPIPKERLDARPESVRCIECKQDKERREATQ